MIAKKVCLLGATSVGKTSLVRRFVKGVFSDQYLTTLGVKIDRKDIDIDGRRITLVVWDLSGEDEFTQLETRYLRGAAGSILVVDRTRPETLDKALEIEARAAGVIGEKPRVLALNKADLEDRSPPAKLELARDRGLTLLDTSAKTGDGVESLFATLAGKLADDPGDS